MAIVGPNSMGVINNFDGVAIWPDLNDLEAVRGPGVAIISQSGAILFGITNTERAYPMGYALSIGNQAVVDAADAIDTVLDDERVRVVGLYLEGLSDGVALGEALARANRQDVPVVLLRGGGTPAAAERALSHTGKLAVPNDFWQALIDRYALVSVRSPKQLVETTKLLAVAGVPAGPRVFVTTYSGAACTLVAEQAPEGGLELPPVPPANLERVRAVELRRALARRREHSRLRRAIPQCVLGGRSPHLRWPHQPPVPAGRRDHGGSGTRLLPRDRRGRGGRGVDDVSESTGRALRPSRTDPLGSKYARTPEARHRQSGLCLNHRGKVTGVRAFPRGGTQSSGQARQSSAKQAGWSRTPGSPGGTGSERHSRKVD